MSSRKKAAGMGLRAPKQAPADETEKRTSYGTMSDPVRRKSDGKATRSTTVTLTVETADRLRDFAHRKRRRQSAVVEEALRAFLGFADE